MSAKTKAVALRNQPITHSAAPSEDIGIVALEPRIMMDGVLDLGLDTYFTGQSASDALSDLIHLAVDVSDQFNALSGLLTDRLGTALGSAADLFTSESDNPYETRTGQAFDDAFAALSTLGEQVSQGILSDISTQISNAMSAVLAQMKTEFQSTTDSYFSGLSADQLSSVHSFIDNSVDTLGLDTLFSAEASFRAILDNVETQAGTLASVSSPGTGPSAPPDFYSDAQRDAMAHALKDKFIDAIAGKITPGIIDTKIDLKDITSGGNTIVGFSGNGSTVAVTVDFGQMLADFSSIFETLGFSADTVTSWTDMLDDVADTTFSFDLTAIAAAKSLTLTLDNFDSTLLSFGGAVDSDYIEDLNFTSGLFSAGVTGIDLAQFDLILEGSVSLGFNLENFSTSLTTSDDLLALSITEAGSSTSADFDPAAEYRYVSVGFSAALDWGLDNIFTEAGGTLPASFGIDGTFALVGSSSSLHLDATAAVKAYDASHNQITPSAENQARLDAFTETVLGLTRLDGSALMNALASAVSGLDVLFQADLFDIDLPLLDGFDLTKLTNLYQAVATTLLKPLSADIDLLGLVKGTDQAENGHLLIQGIVADAETGHVFADQGGQNLAFTINAQLNGASHGFVLTIAVPQDGFDSVSALAAALKAAMAATATTASDLGADRTLANFLAVNEVRGDIELRANGLSGFSLAGDAGVLALLGVAAAKDTAGTGRPLSGNSLASLASSDWMKFFQFNLNLERTVTYADGSQEVVSYRSLTMTPDGGGWSVVGLAGQLNDFFEAAGIAMQASVNGAGGLDFTVDQAKADIAYAKAGTTITDTSFRFAMDGAHASVASSLEVLKSYVETVVGEAIPGATLDIDIGTGQLVLRFPEIAFGAETAFEAALAANLGALAEIDVEAAFALAAKFELGFAIGADLKGLLASAADSLVTDYIFLEDVHLAAEISALAADISGTGRLGIVEVALGGAGTNSVEIGARLDVGLIGEDGEGDYTGRIAFSQLMSGANSLAGITDLIGTFDLTGTADDGAFVLVTFEDIRVGISGVNIGIEDDAINSVRAGLYDIFAPTDWQLDIDSPIVSLITGLGKNDFVDTLYNSLILVDQLLNGLAQNAGFLSADIPVLGINLLDAMDFASNLAGQLQAFKNSPDAGLADLSASLASAFGLDSDELQLVWDGDNSIFYVSLGLSFIDAPLEYDFSLDLAELLGSMVGSDSAVANLLSVASSLGNVTGDGRIVLDAALGFDLTFGVDLSSVLGTNLDPVTTATALASLSGISQLSYNTANSGHNGRDVLISVARTGNGAPVYMDVKAELDDAATVGEAVALMFDAIKAANYGDDIGIKVHGLDGSGQAVTLLIDNANKALADFGVAGLTIQSLEFVDLGVAPLDFAGAEALFGASEPLDLADGELVLTGLDLDDVDTAAAYKFGLVINDAGPYEISIAAEGGRDAAGFVAALQAALAAAMVSRADIGLGLPADLRLDKLISAGLSADNKLELNLTNFADAIGKDQIGLTLTGAPTGASATVSVLDLGGSNLAQALGFGGGEGKLALQGEMLEARPDDDGVSAFLVTQDITVNGKVLGGTGIAFEFIAGVPDGLNMTLALGPLSVSVVDGVAVIGDGNGGKAHVSFGLDDAVDDYLGHGADDGRVYFGAIGDLFTGNAPGDLSDLFTFDAAVALDLVLPLEDSLGLLRTVEDAGITIKGELFTANGRFSDAEGALVALVKPGLSVSDYLSIEINLPSFDEILSNLNPFAIINDPILLTNGLDMILSALNKTLRSVIKAMDLPIVGDAMNQGLTVFNDIAYAILRPIQEAANTPNPDGSMPTTIDLIERVVNGALKSLFGVDQDVIRAVLTEDMDNPSIVAEIFLEDFTIFEAALDVGFDLGIPGLALNVGQNSALLFEIIADINIAFGIDKNGFFFLNDTDAPEIVLQALVRTSDDFTASASLGLVGLALTANKIENSGFGDDIYGAVIGGRIEIDLFTSLGHSIDYSRFDDEVATYGRDNGYENIVRLNELSTAKSGSGEGTRMVSISGEFAVHVDMHLTSSVVNPVTGAAITELPSALADFVFDASYRIGGELEMQRLEFQDVGLYAGDFLAHNVLPVLQEINGYVKPIADMVQFLKDTGIGDFTLYSLIHKITEYTYPAALFVFDAIDTITGVIDFIDGLGPDATVYFGSFSLLSASSSTGVVDTGNAKTMGNLRPGSTASQSSSLQLEGAITNNKPGISFDLVLFTDVSNVLNLITGNLAEVELFEIDLTLLDFTLNIDLVAAIKSAVSFLPGQVVDVLFGGFQASFYVHAEAGITVGYDLYGIAEFLGSGKASDILDGMYFDADRSLLELDAAFNVGIGINLGIIKAGLGLSGYFSLEISMNDPNQDGKLRFGELVWVVQEYSVLDLFEGSISLGLNFNVYFELNLFFFSIGGSWDWTIIDFSAHFGRDFMSNPHFLDTSSDGVTTLNVGATAGGQVGGSAVDGDDDISFDGNRVFINGHDAGTISGHTVLIYAGQGNNNIDVSGLSSSISFQIFTGDGDDTVIVGDSSGIISTGAGNDTVLYGGVGSLVNFAAFGLGAFAPLAAAPAAMPTGSAPTSYGAVSSRLPATSNQTLLIMADNGITIDMSGSAIDMIVVGTSLDIVGDRGERVTLSDWAQAKFQGGEPDMALVRDKIDRAMLTYTVDGQTRADSGASYIITGSGDDIIITGNGNDIIDAGSGNNIVLSGDGDDRITLRGAGNNWVEAGAGSDLVIGSDGNDTIMGWGRYDTTTTDAEYTEALGAVMTGTELADFKQLVRTLVIDDGNDWIEGRGGDDIIVGNGGGRNVLIGGDDNDIIVSGSGSDIIAGGDIRIYLANGSEAPREAGFNPAGKFDIVTQLGADGSDILYGSAGNNVIIGGGDDDWIEGVAGSNVLIGDFARITLSGTATILRVTATYIDAVEQGNDVILGGALADIAMGGGGEDVISGDNGKNVLIGDNADLVSTNLFEGVTRLTSFLGAWDDADTIYSGVASSIIVAGGSRQAHGDYISTGHFYGASPDSAIQGVIVFADYGDIEGALLAPAIMTTTFDAGDDDMVLTGSGSDVIFGGAGHDIISSDQGDDKIFGDTGTYRLDASGLFVTLSTDHDALSNPHPGQTGNSRTLDGDDNILALDGANVIFGGGGSDIILAGNGGNLIIGDNGLVRYGIAGNQLGRLYAEGRDTDVGGDDIILIGSGMDAVMGGMGDDIIDTGAGNDLAMGDWARIDFVERTLTTQSPEHGGNDLIAAGDGDDIAIGGFGDDFMAGGGDANVLVGDYASLTWTGDFDLETLELDAIQYFGDDVIYTNHAPGFGSGSNAEASSIAIGGRGNDVLFGGSASDLLMGDWAIFAFLSPQTLPGVPAFERIMWAESTENWSSGDDMLYGGDGRNIMIAGDGDDIVIGGRDQDLIASDAAIYVNYHDGWELLETRYPFDGGDDIIDGGPGNDIIISGFFNFGKPGAGDFLYGNTIEDFMMGTSGSILIFNSKVIRFNYLGIETKELISNNQLGASAGVLMRPAFYQPEPLLFGTPGQIVERQWGEDGFAFAPESEISRQEPAWLLQFDTVMHQILLDSDMLQLLELYRQGTISADDLEQAIREAVMAMLSDRYGQSIPMRMLDMLERYLDLLLAQLDGQGQQAGQTEAAPADAG